MKAVLRIPLAGLLAGTLSLLAGCGGTGVIDKNMATIDIEPGSNVTCPGDPCQIYFTMPFLDDKTYTISARNDERGIFFMGSHKSGTRSYLGKLSSVSKGSTTDYAIVVEKTQLPVAYVTVPGVN